MDIFCHLVFCNWVEETPLVVAPLHTEKGRVGVKQRISTKETKEK